MRVNQHKIYIFGIPSGDLFGTKIAGEAHGDELSSITPLGRIHTRIPECDSRIRLKKVSRLSHSAVSSPHSPHFCSHSPTFGRASILSQFNLVLSFNVKMDEAEILAVWYLARKANKKCNRKLGCIPLTKTVEKRVHTLCCTKNLWMIAQSFSIISG